MADFPEDLYTNATPTTATVGGVPAGTTFLDQTCTEVFDMLFYPYIYPYFSAFSFTGISVLEVGDSIDSAVQPITWTTAIPANVAINSINIDDRGAGEEALWSTSKRVWLIPVPSSMIFR